MLYEILSNKLKAQLETLKNIKGDFGEFGVYKGNTFVQLLSITKKQKKKAHAFDSFKGMAEPTKEDYDLKGKTNYPKGKFDVNGSFSLINRLNSLGYKQNQDYIIWEGYIPQIFEKVEKNIIFSFCYIDLDHYKPTVDTLKWIWERLSIGGIILCDDYISNAYKLASKAIDEFLNFKDIKITERYNWVIYNKNRYLSQILFKKGEK